MSDNTISVYRINNMGWNKSDLCNQTVFESINPVSPDKYRFSYQNKILPF